MCRSRVITTALRWELSDCGSGANMSQDWKSPLQRMYGINISFAPESAWSGMDTQAMATRLNKRKALIAPRRSASISRVSSGTDCGFLSRACCLLRCVIFATKSFFSKDTGRKLTIPPTLVYSMPCCTKPMTNSPARDLFPGALEMMILESLRRQPAHGYALVQHIQQRSNNLLQVEEGSLYPALQRLLKADLVKAKWGVSSTNRRVRTYQITASGLRHLEQEISSFEKMFAGIALVLNPGKATPS